MRRFLGTVVWVVTFGVSFWWAVNVVCAQNEPEHTLAKYLQAICEDPLLENTLIGARVDSLDTDQSVFNYNPHQLINPASVTKVFTTAAALSLLHPDYCFRTEVYALSKPENGVVDGPLYLKGYGDPFLVNERLTYLASELRCLGIAKIKGPVILDDTQFDSISEGPGWSQDNSSCPYRAPVGALSLNFNSVAILIFPGKCSGCKTRVEVVPDSDHFKLENTLRTTTRGYERILVYTSNLDNQTNITVRGRVSAHHPVSRYYCRVTSPTWYTGRSFIQVLQREGIETSKVVQQGRVPEHAYLIYTFFSPPLGELVCKVNKLSQNFMAEQIYKTIGLELIGQPGTWYKGEQAMSAFLSEQVGILPGTYVLHNGSGLNDVNRVTASHVVEVLKYIWNKPDIRPEFLSSLAIAGVDGTIEERFQHPRLRRTMRLKTGSLRKVRSLAGYVTTHHNETFAFCLMLSRYKCSNDDAMRLIDQFASALSCVNAKGQVFPEAENLARDLFPIDDSTVHPEVILSTETPEIPCGEIIDAP